MGRRGPAVIGILTEPARPTWWAAHRHLVYGIAGLLIGVWLSTLLTGDGDTPRRPDRPGHTTPAPATPGTHNA
ncbi:hypothetical protein [Streptomyces sp. NPDC017941]|uniref:hypothetical protein n=1 Tax=unclassified Streptomyces TaxID=2593676 RepID=UPI0037A43A2E